MNKYENIIIMIPDITDKNKKEIKKDYKTILNNELEFEELGIKKLAYEITRNNKKYKEGSYMVTRFKGTGADVQSLEAYIRTNENIIKFITIRNEEI